MKYINQEKLKEIKLNKLNFYVAIDFDKTITKEWSCSSWDATGNIFGDKFKNRSKELYEEYRPIELDYNITFEEKNKAMEEWYYKCLDLYYEFGLTEEKMNKSIDESEIEFRQYAKEFFEYMNENNIPVIILSAGIGNVIERFLKKENCYYDNIYIISNFLKFDKMGNIEPYKGELIQTLNKTMKGHLNKEFLQNIKKRDYRLLVGDLIEDKDMVPKEEWDKTILIGFLGDESEKNFEKYTRNFDIVLSNEDADFNTIKNLVL